jgi:hypothetical protein
VASPALGLEATRRSGRRSRRRRRCRRRSRAARGGGMTGRLYDGAVTDADPEGGGKLFHYYLTTI